MRQFSLHRCYNEIIKETNATRNKAALAIHYAASYARHGLKLDDALEPAQLTDEARVQALYVRTNLHGWRGPMAKDVRANIDRIIKKGK